MTRVAPGASEQAETEKLTELAESVRGSFQTVEAMAQEFIREAIHRGVFPPGHRLNLDQIAATLGVSRMPVRASLRQLANEDLVRIHPYRGATVAVLHAEEIAEIYELRTLLEGYLLERAIQRMDDLVIDELEVLAHALDEPQDLVSKLDKRRAFYQRLYEQAGRPRALEQVNHLRGSVGRYLLLQQVHEQHRHSELLTHLRDRDTAAARVWLDAHLAHVSRALQQLVSEAADEIA